MHGIVFNLCFGSFDSAFHGDKVCVSVALDLLRTDFILFDTFFKFVCPFTGTRNVRIMELVPYIHSRIVWEPLSKLRKFSQLFIVYVVKN